MNIYLPFILATVRIALFLGLIAMYETRLADLHRELKQARNQCVEAVE